MKFGSDHFQKKLNHVAPKPDRHRSSTAGFTLIESLVAIVVISITLVAITPPIFWATGTRVQNRRAEQALALAQGEIDRVRAEIERGGTPSVDDLPKSIGATDNLKLHPGPAPGAAWDKVRSTADNVVPDTERQIPAGTARYPLTSQYIPVYTSKDGKPDFLIQVFRNDGICDKSGTLIPCTAADTPRVFSMMVRVYAGIAAQSSSPTLQTEKASLTGSTGTGQSGFRPLAVLSSKVARSVNSKSLEQYRQSVP